MSKQATADVHEVPSSEVRPGDIIVGSSVELFLVLGRQGSSDTGFRFIVSTVFLDGRFSGQQTERHVDCGGKSVQRVLKGVEVRDGE